MRFKAPPPLPSYFLGSDCVTVLDVVYACSGEPVKATIGCNLKLNVDFTHSIKDVESAINVFAQKSLRDTVHIVDPLSETPSDLLLTLCKKKENFQSASCYREH